MVVLGVMNRYGMKRHIQLGSATTNLFLCSLFIVLRTCSSFLLIDGLFPACHYLSAFLRVMVALKMCGHPTVITLL